MAEEWTIAALGRLAEALKHSALPHKAAAPGWLRMVASAQPFWPLIPPSVEMLQNTDWRFQECCTSKLIHSSRHQPPS
jgi:hypothetical protein